MAQRQGRLWTHRLSFATCTSNHAIPENGGCEVVKNLLHLETSLYLHPFVIADVVVEVGFSDQTSFSQIVRSKLTLSGCRPFSP